MTLLPLGIICEATPLECTYASPILVVAKKDGTLRMRVDYSQLNQLTIKDLYPLPGIDEILTALHNAYCFLSLDLLSGYHQIHGCEEHRPKTAFITHKGLYVFTVIPFGRWKAPAPFQGLMDGIFPDQITKDLAAYRGDLLMYALRHAEMLPILQRAFGELIDAGKKCKPSKWQVFHDSRQYLGDIIKDAKIAADRSK